MITAGGARRPRARICPPTFITATRICRRPKRMTGKAGRGVSVSSFTWGGHLVGDRKQASRTTGLLAGRAGRSRRGETGVALKCAIPLRR